MRLVGWNASGEALIIQKFEQGGETLLIPVVGRRRDEDLVLEMGRKGTDGRSSEGIRRVAPPTRRGDIVRFVHDQYIKAARIDRLALLGESLTEKQWDAL